LRTAWAVLLTAVASLLAGMWIGGHPENLPEPVRDLFVESRITPGESVSDEALGVIGDSYFREVDPGQLEDASIRGMVRRLREQYDDRFTHYFDPEQLARFNEAIDGSFSGVGMTVGEMGEEGLRIGRVFRRSPAERAGIESGDVIVTVDGESIRGEATELVVAKIKGPEGTEVTLGVRRQGEGSPADVTVTREEIRVPITSSRVREIDGRRLGYVRLSTFSEGAGAALRRATERAIDDGAEGIVLDLRANGGGLLPEAILTSSVFVPEGEVVVETRSRTKGDTVYQAVGGNLDPPPMVVLVDRDTASAAEILAAALQSVNDDPVVGTRTFGKGVFQQVIDLDNGGALDLTVGEFVTGDGVSLAGKGLEPDVVAPLRPGAGRDTQLDRAYEVLSDEIDADGGG
jgi:carboxyl-terminal processing protease